MSITYWSDSLCTSKTNQVTAYGTCGALSATLYGTAVCNGGNLDVVSYNDSACTLNAKSYTPSVTGCNADQWDVSGYFTAYCNSAAGFSASLLGFLFVLMALFIQ